MVVDANIYDARFFQNTIKFEEPSARAVADILIEHFAPRSVVDIGCGCGIYLAEFKKRGVEILGYDGSPLALAASLVGNSSPHLHCETLNSAGENIVERCGDEIKLHDLGEPLILNKKFDLALCVEVAEHLPPEFAGTLLQTLTDASDTIIFTAATPGQGPRSIGHINEQPHQFWIEKLKAKRFMLDKKSTTAIKKEMADKEVVWWVVKNLMIFKKI